MFDKDGNGFISAAEVTLDIAPTLKKAIAVLVGFRHTSGPCELHLCPVVTAYTRYNAACSPLDAASFVMMACSNSRVPPPCSSRGLGPAGNVWNFPP